LAGVGTPGNTEVTERLFKNEQNNNRRTTSSPLIPTIPVCKKDCKIKMSQQESFSTTAAQHCNSLGGSTHVNVSHVKNTDNFSEL